MEKTCDVASTRQNDKGDPTAGEKSSDLDKTQIDDRKREEILLACMEFKRQELVYWTNLDVAKTDLDKKKKAIDCYIWGLVECSFQGLTKIFGRPKFMEMAKESIRLCQKLLENEQERCQTKEKLLTFVEELLHMVEQLEDQIIDQQNIISLQKARIEELEKLYSEAIKEKESEKESIDEEDVQKEEEGHELDEEKKEKEEPTLERAQSGILRAVRKFFNI